MSDQACRSCKAPILWAISSKTGNRIPINEAPPEPGKGNVMLDAPLSPGPPTARYVTPGEGSHVTHFVTCPDADSWRK